MNAMGAGPYHVLFLCTGNSARSIMAESILNFWGEGKFRGYSAGSQPKGDVHPMALELITRLDFPTESLRSKSWKEFTQPDAPKMNFVFTVCDNAAAENCPTWPGKPMMAHWGVADPAAVEGESGQKMLAFRQAFQELENRIKIFINLPLSSLDAMKLEQHVKEIGRTTI